MKAKILIGAVFDIDKFHLSVVLRVTDLECIDPHNVGKRKVCFSLILETYSHLEFVAGKGVGRAEEVALVKAGIRVTFEHVADVEKVAAVEQ